MSDWTMKQHDTLPSIQATFSTLAGPTDLTAAVSIKFVMSLRTPMGSTPKINAIATIVAPATSGVVQYDWIAADVDTIGEYSAEWQVIWPGNKKQTFPTETYHTISIIGDLDLA